MEDLLTFSDASAPDVSGFFYPMIIAAAPNREGQLVLSDFKGVFQTVKLIGSAHQNLGISLSGVHFDDQLVGSRPPPAWKPRHKH